MSKTIDMDAVIAEITSRYEVYGKEGSDKIQKAYEYAKKCHE